MKYALNFYTEYNQFYISSDRGKSIENHPKGMFSSDNGRLIELPNLLIVCTENYGPIKGIFYELNEERKDFDLDEYDHIVEGCIDVESGILQILDCPFSSIEFEIKINPGTYMVRIYFSNVPGYYLDEDEGVEYYIIEVWPSKRMTKRILKGLL